EANGSFLFAFDRHGTRHHALRGHGTRDGGPGMELESSPTAHSLRPSRMVLSWEAFLAISHRLRLPAMGARCLPCRGVFSDFDFFSPSGDSLEAAKLLGRRPPGGARLFRGESFP